MIHETGCACYIPRVLDSLVYGHRHILKRVLQVPLVVGQLGDRALLDQLLSGHHPSIGAEPIDAICIFCLRLY